MGRIDTVIFDLGGVLLTSGRPVDLVRRYPGVDHERMNAVLMGDYASDTDHPWHRLERGEITLAECKALNKALLAEAGIVLPRRAPRDASPDRPKRSPLNEAMISLVVELRAAGFRTGMLTNNVAEYRAGWWPLADWPALFDDVVDSHEVRLRKPNPAIYHLALDRLGAAPATSAFLDDAPGNVEGAKAVGMHAYHVVGDGGDAIAAVRALAGLPIG